MAFEAVNQWTPLTRADALPRNVIKGSATVGVGALTRNPRLISRRSLRTLLSTGVPRATFVPNGSVTIIIAQTPFRTSGDTLGQLTYVMWADNIDATWTVRDTAGTTIETETMSATSGSPEEVVITTPTALASDTLYTIEVTAEGAGVLSGEIYALTLYEVR